MRKRLTLLLLLILVCVSTSGCVAMDVMSGKLNPRRWVDETKAAVRSDDLKKQFADNNQYKQEESTYKAGLKASKLQDKANKDDFFTGLPLVGGWIKDRRISKAAQAKDKYETACASDKTLIADRKAHSVDIFNGGKFSIADIPTPLLLVLLLLFLGILFAILKTQKAKAKAIKKGTYDNSAEVMKEQTKQMKEMAKTQEKQAEQQLKLQEKQLEIHEAKETKANLIAVNPERQAASAKARCEKWGLNYEELLAQHGGDPVALNQKLIVSRPEDFK